MLYGNQIKRVLPTPRPLCFFYRPRQRDINILPVEATIYENILIEHHVLRESWPRGNRTNAHTTTASFEMPRAFNLNSRKNLFSTYRKYSRSNHHIFSVARATAFPSAARKQIRDIYPHIYPAGKLLSLLPLLSIKITPCGVRHNGAHKRTTRGHGA